MIGDIPPEMVGKAVNHALELTWAKNFNQHGNLWNNMASKVIDSVNRMPVISWFFPFPRFVANSIQWQVEHSPLGLFQYARPDSREKLRRGDVRGISNALVGTTMYFTARYLRSKDEEGNYKYGATNNWYLWKVPEGPVAEFFGLEPGTEFDIRPYAPFSSYFLWAYLNEKGFEPAVLNMLDGGDRKSELNSLSYTDLAQGVIGTTARAGLGLYVLDQMMEDLANISGSGSPGGESGAIIGTGLGNVAASYFVPLNQLYEGYKGFEQFHNEFESSKVRDARQEMGHGDITEDNILAEGFFDNFGESFTGQIGARIAPFAAMEAEPRSIFGGDGERYEDTRMYPEVQLPTRRDAPRSYAPIIKALTGFTFKGPRNAYEKEAAKFDFSRSDILPSSGYPAWDRAVAQQMGPLIEDVVVPRLEKPSYKDKSRAEKVSELREWTAMARDKARLQASFIHPHLWSIVRKSRGDSRNREVIEERFQRAERDRLSQ